MPLILAAIDLKLSPSCDEMKIRQRRLDSLSRIIRLSESLYDVTDFVAAGTNHILQLAYVTTQNFFLPSKPSSRMINEKTGHNLIEKRMDPQIPNLTRIRNSNPTRAKSWLDAFLRCPRAYLLISTSVDYSLAVGRLPYDTSLPALVRDIPAMGAMMQLPWTIDTGSRGALYIHRCAVPAPSDCGEKSVDSVAATSAASTQVQESRTLTQNLTGKRLPTNETTEWKENSTNVDDPPQIGFKPPVHTPGTSCEPMSTAINLDFLELGANLDSEDIVCYDSPIKTYDSFDSLPIGFLDEKDVRPGRLRSHRA